MAAPVVGDKAVVQEGSAVGLDRQFANTTHKMGIVVPHKAKKKQKRNLFVKGVYLSGFIKNGYVHASFINCDLDPCCLHNDMSPLSPTFRNEPGLLTAST